MTALGLFLALELAEHLAPDALPGLAWPVLYLINLIAVAVYNEVLYTAYRVFRQDFKFSKVGGRLCIVKCDRHLIYTALYSFKLTVEYDLALMNKAHN